MKAVTKGRVTAAVFMDFLKRLLVDARTPIFVVVDGHPTHRAKSVARFAAEQAGKLALFDDRKLAIVTIKRKSRLGDAPDLTPEELQRRGEAADALWRELVRT
jgi:hypothetical protein